MFATIDVVELLLCDRVVDVDSLEKKFAFSSHLFESMDTSSCFLRETNEFLAHLCPHVSDTLLEILSQQAEDNLELLILG